MLTHQWVLDNFEYRADGLYWQTTNQKRKTGHRAGSMDNRGYRSIGLRINGKLLRYFEHRLCWFYMTGQWPQHMIDHVDRDKSNNAWSNLREATRSQNAMNQNATGVYWNKDRLKWQAQIKVNGKPKNIGRFINYDEALKARQEAEIKYFGEFAPIRG